MKHKDEHVMASEKELAEALAAVLRGTTLVRVQDAAEWGATLARRVVQRLSERRNEADKS